MYPDYVNIMSRLYHDYVKIVEFTCFLVFAAYQLAPGREASKPLSRFG